MALAHASLQRRAPFHYRRAPPPKGGTPVRLMQLLKTHFLELSRWFSTHIRYMRDLKLSSLRPGTISIDRYKFGCLQWQLSYGSVQAYVALANLETNCAKANVAPAQRET
jgi:hypothetical protein